MQHHSKELMSKIRTLNHQEHLELDILVVCRRLEVRVQSDHFSDEGMALLLDLLPRAILTGV